MEQAVRPTLGVLITYYNEKHLLTECLESLLNGTQLPDEILVYDDGSTSPAQDYIPQHPLIRVLRGEQNVGMVRARWQCVQHSTSDYLHFHDADDLFMPAWTEKVRATLPNADYIVTHGYVQDDGNRSLFPYLNAAELQRDFRRYAICYGINTISPVFHRRLVQSAMHEKAVVTGGAWDFYSNSVMTAHAERFVFIDEPLYVIRMRTGSMSRTENNVERPETYLRRMDALRLLIDDLPQQRPLLMEVVAIHGGRLYKRGLPSKAREAFALAHSLGQPTYAHQGLPWRTLSRTLGPLTSERLFQLYTHPALTHLRARVKGLLRR